MTATVNTMILPPVVVHYWDRLAEKYARKSGEACTHLFDNEKYNSIKSRKRKKEYESGCCAIECKISTTLPFRKDKFTVEITRRSHDFSKRKICECSQKFPETTKLIQKHFLALYKNIYGKK